MLAPDFCLELDDVAVLHGSRVWGRSPRVARTFACYPLHAAIFACYGYSMSEPDNHVLYARCTPELLRAAREAAEGREQTIGGFIRLAVAQAIEKTGVPLPSQNKLARRKRKP